MTRNTERTNSMTDEIGIVFFNRLLYKKPSETEVSDDIRYEKTILTDCFSNV